MHEKDVYTETVRKVYSEGNSVEVGEWPDATDHLELRTSGASNIGYFGQLSLTMSPAFALALGQALVAAATEKGAK